ncbi:ribonuclease Y [Mariniblastus fucicola]|uniref:Ribonuclease Y n=1 Tax=Mariniblastus fucicola TaxID=980251 RepID=A0A5B9PFZ9_9BACT|nr:ribonuclease Y [Mariniblastus fucicola]QEG23682.1 Ribonuclease Y [Mariniblastus fucicola]
MDYFWFTIGFLVAAVAGVAWTLLAPGGARNRSKAILDDADRQSKNMLKEADVTIRQMELEKQKELEKELKHSRDELHQRERKLDKLDSTLEQKSIDLNKQEAIVAASQSRLKIKLEQIAQHENDIIEVLEKQRKKLHEVTGLSKEDASTRLLKLLEDELADEVGGRILRHEKQMEEICQQKSRDILTMTMQRLASDHTANLTTSTIDIPNDEMKGRIIGREGRNIRAFEQETGIDVIIDDTPGVVIISGFDPVRREVAKLSLEKLIGDGRIHPTRIEEVTRETQAEIDQIILQKGREALEEVNIHGINDRIIEMLGRLHYRTSYSQNVLRHSIEVAFLSGMLAEMMGLDADLARRAGLLHDIGKAADHEIEGGHPKVGADMLKRAGESPEVVHAALGHHDQILVEHPYTVIVATADACSASRPGARRESLDRYVKRMEELESLAIEFNGVRRAYAVQAGREVRVVVASKDVSDEKAAKICRDIAHAYQEQLSFPGEIKVVVIRESRFTELAK